MTYPPDAESRYHPAPAPPVGPRHSPRYNPLPPTPDTSGQLHLDGTARPGRLSTGAVLAVVLGTLCVVSFVVAILIGGI